MAPDAWVPVPLRWRHILPGDMVVAPDDQIWHVIEVWSGKCSTTATAERGKERFSRDVDPDDVIPVLVPVVERDAVELTRDQLGARLVERRTTAPQQT